MEEAKVVSKLLSENFPKTFDGRPLFRLVWSEDMTEVRKGAFSDYYGDIFLREVTEVRKVKKYDFIKDRYILERLYIGKADPTGELVQAESGSYEPVFVFQRPNGDYLKPIWRAVELLCKCSLDPEYLKRKMSPSDIVDAERDKEQKQILDMMDYLEDIGHSYIGSALATGSGIVVPNSYES